MSVYKRVGGWAARIDLEPTATGLRRRKYIGTYATKKAAQQAERDALTSRERGVDMTPEAATISELVARFIADRRARERAYRTVARYDDIARLQINPHLGTIQLAKLKPAHVSGWLTTLATRGGVTGRPLSPKSVKHAFNLLDTALRWAVRLDLVPLNPCDRVDKPTAGRSQARALTDDETTRFFAAADATRWSSYFRIAVSTAARRGELCALRWSDVDFERREVTISRNMIETNTPGARLVEKTTKTDRARVIPFGTLAYEALRAQRSLQAKDRLAYGTLFSDSGHVFQTPLGGPVAPYLATDAFRAIRTRLCITASLHSLRHSAATRMLASGVDVRTVAAVLGHSSAATTLSVYAHVVAGHERAAVDILSERLDRTIGKAEKS